MKTRDQNLDKQPIDYARRSHGHGGLALMATLAFLLSLLSLLVSGFLAYRFLNLQQAFAVIDGALKQPVPATPDSGANQTNQAPTETASSTVGAQPSQFVQPAIGTLAQVELVSIRRIQNPQTQTRDLVNVQMRVRRSTSETGNINPNDALLSPSGTTARNSNTGEVYQSVDGLQNTATPISISQLAPGAFADASVQLRIPEGVTAIDLLVPKTQVFRNVPISE